MHRSLGLGSVLLMLSYILLLSLLDAGYSLRHVVLLFKLFKLPKSGDQCVKCGRIEADLTVFVICVPFSWKILPLRCWNSLRV